MTDILDLDGWKVVAKYIDGDDYLIEAEYTVVPKACTKCGNIGNLYKHGPNRISIRKILVHRTPRTALATRKRIEPHPQRASSPPAAHQQPASSP